MFFATSGTGARNVANRIECDGCLPTTRTWPTGTALARSRERDRRLVQAEAIPIVGEAAQEHARACNASASTSKRSHGLETEFDVVANGALQQSRPQGTGSRLVDIGVSAGRVHRCSLRVAASASRGRRAAVSRLRITRPDRCRGVDVVLPRSGQRRRAAMVRLWKRAHRPLETRPERRALLEHRCPPSARRDRAAALSRLGDQVRSRPPGARARPSTAAAGSRCCRPHRRRSVPRGGRVDDSSRSCAHQRRSVSAANEAVSWSWPTSTNPALAQMS